MLGSRQGGGEPSDDYGSRAPASRGGGGKPAARSSNNMSDMDDDIPF